MWALGNLTSEILEFRLIAFACGAFEKLVPLIKSSIEILEKKRNQEKLK